MPDDTRRNLILAINAGSSSLKISLFVRVDSVGEEYAQLVLTSSISSLSAPPAMFSFNPTFSNMQNTLDEADESITDHASAFARFLDCLYKYASIDKERIVYVCHRVVHGGDYRSPVIINRESYDHIEHLSDLAPLHNGAALSVMRACISALPNAKSIAYFDTAFHRPIPIHIASYAIDQKVAMKRGLKKYGFHGLSYAFVLRSVSKFLNKAPDTLNLIILHLGSGASACAVKNGLSLDTSMGLTPLNGLPGATRSGAIDPSLIFHYTNRAGRITHDPKMATHVGVTLAEDILNRQAGWRAITGTTDFAVITKHADLANSDFDIATRNPYRLAFDLFVDRILNYVGSYHLKLGGDVDALVFAGGIGERSAHLRRIVSEKVGCLGYSKIDLGKNEFLTHEDEGQTVVDISSPESVDFRRVLEREKKILICRTDEQLEMARGCATDPKYWDGN